MYRLLGTPQRAARPIVKSGPLLLALLIGLAGCGDFAVSDVEYVQRAKDYLDKGNARAAVIELKNALEKNPKNPEARWILGTTYVDLQDGASAEKELRRAGALGVAPEATLIPLGQALILQGKYASVLEQVTLQDAFSADERAKVYALWGHAHLGLGDIAKARGAYRDALDIASESTMAMIGMGRVSAVTGDLDEARGWVGKALNIDPDSLEAWSLLGDIEQTDKRLVQAKEAYDRAISLSKHNNVIGRVKRALLLIAMNDLEAAEKDVLDVKRVMPDLPLVLYAEGLAYFKKKKYAEAQNAFESALRGADIPQAIYFLGVSHYLQNHMQQAETYMARYLLYNPGSAEASKILGAIKFSNRDYKGAESVLGPVLVNAPDDLVVLKMIGTSVLAQGRMLEGMDYLQRFVEKQPDGGVKERMEMQLALLSEAGGDGNLFGLEGEAGPQVLDAEVAGILRHLHAGEFDQAIAVARAMHEETPDDAAPLTFMGIGYLGKGDVERARASFEKALKAAPGDPAAAHHLAKIEISKGDVAAARVLYQSVLERQPGHELTLVALAELEERQGDSTAAKSRLEQAIKAHPEALQPRVFLARLYVNEGMPFQALNILQEIQQLYADNPLLLLEVGRAQLAMGQAENAVATLERLAKHAAGSAEVHYLLATAYGATNNSAGARRALDRVLSLDPGHFRASVAMARLMIVENQGIGADKLIKELRRAHPENAEVLGLEGDLAMVEQRPRDAVNAYAGALRLTPENSRWAINLATAQWHAEGPQAAIATLRRWLTTYPENADAQYALAEAYLNLKQEEQARQAFARFLELSPDHVLALNNLAWLSREVAPEKALRYARRAQHLAPESPAVLDTLGMILVDREQLDEATSLLRRASELAPSVRDIRFHYALALSRRGDLALATEILDGVLRGDEAFEGRESAEQLRKNLGGSRIPASAPATP